MDDKGQHRCKSGRPRKLPERKANKKFKGYLKEGDASEKLVRDYLDSVGPYCWYECDSIQINREGKKKEPDFRVWLCDGRSFFLEVTEKGPPRSEEEPVVLIPGTHQAVYVDGNEEIRDIKDAVKRKVAQAPAVRAPYVIVVSRAFRSKTLQSNVAFSYTSADALALTMDEHPEWTRANSHISAVAMTVDLDLAHAERTRWAANPYTETDVPWDDDALGIRSALAMELLVNHQAECVFDPSLLCGPRDIVWSHDGWEKGAPVLKVIAAGPLAKESRGGSF